MRVQAGASTWWLYGGVDVRVDVSDLAREVPYLLCTVQYIVKKGWTE